MADLVRGKNVSQALELLQFSRKGAAVDMGKLIRSAAANASVKGGVRVDSLYVKKVMVNAGPIMKRFMPRAKGSASAIQKKMSHLIVVLEERV